MLGTIRQRLVVLLLIAVVPLVAATSLVVYRFAQTQLAAQQGAILASANSLAATVDAEVHKHIAIAYSLATSSWLNNGNLRGFYDRAVTTIAFLPNSRALLVAPDGQVLLDTAQPFGAPLHKLATHDTHDRAIATGQTQVSNIFLSTARQRPMASVHVPAVRDGKAVYNVIVTVDPDNFLRILLEQQLPAGWLSAIIDRNGRFIARSRNHAGNLGGEANDTWRSAARERSVGQFENVSLEGEPLFSAFANSRLTGWSISVSAEQRVVMAPLRRTLTVIGLSAGGLLAISIAMAWWVARRISGPMQALERAARALLRDEPAHVGRTGLREIDQALAAFESSSRTLLERDERYRSLFEHAADAILIADAAGHCIDVNPATGRLLGAPRQALVDRPISELFDSADAGRLAAIRDRVLRGETLVEEWDLPHHNGGMVPVEISTTLLPDGHWYVFVRDLTQRKLAEAAQKQTEAQFHTLADSIPQLAWMAAPDGWIFWYNRRWFEFTGTTLEAMRKGGWRQVLHPDHVEGVEAGIRHSFETGKPWEDTFPLRGKDGEYRWFLSRALPIHDRSGRIVRWFGTNTDISEQKQTEERQRLLVNELNHRVKNTLAVIQSIATVTSRSASSATAFSKSFIARLLGIARTHDLLTESHWEGAFLRDIVWNELSPYESDGIKRVGLAGEDVRLTPKEAVALGMVMHEMATNAAKYGALSAADGVLKVSWEVSESAGQPLLRLEWSESGGPPVSEPQHSGFGSRLVAQSINRTLGGKVEMHYRPDGLRCLMELPLEAATSAAAAA